MKLLLLDNSSLTPINGDYCIDPKTGAFVKELQGLGNEVTIYGQKVEAKDTTHTYRLLENGLKVVGLKRKKNKLLNYILLYLRIIPEIVKTDFVYVFYPTAYKYVAVLCWLFNKKCWKRVNLRISLPLKYQLWIGFVFLFLQSAVVSQRRLLAYYVVFYILFFVIYRYTPYNVKRQVNFIVIFGFLILQLIDCNTPLILGQRFS